MPSRIEDYAMIGDGLSAALVDRTGSIDWLCLPRFDSRACFAALLGTPEHGRWRIAPKGEPRRVSRKYRGETLILETEFETGEGVVALIDLMPPRGEAPDVVRIVEGREGSVPMRMDLTIRFDYGGIVPWVRRCDGGINAIGGPDLLRLVADGAEVGGEGRSTASEFVVEAGRRIPFVLTYYPSHHPEPDTVDPDRALADTEAWWSEWLRRCCEQNPYREAVVRSLITLKALTYIPTGGIVAAPTTSLPEKIGGPRNWDYRYCWLRDASFCLLAMMEAGYTDEARAWGEWLLRAAAGDPSKLQIMYGVAGERRLEELTLDWLPGFEASSPVRVGNGAWSQHQIDVYGELLDATYLARKAGIEPQEIDGDLILAVLEFLEGYWREPDHGIWEVRGPRRHFVHSKVMAWVAFDRAVRMAEGYGRRGPVDRWRALRAEIHDEVCARGFDPGLNAFVQSYGSPHLDASLLLMADVGFLPAEDPRFLGTVSAIEARLKRGPFVRRYDSDEDVDGMPTGEGAFLPCSFWLADAYALSGRLDDARRLFEQLLAIRNDVGLLSEEVDPATGRFLGNFPQALSHMALIMTARRLEGRPARGFPDDRDRLFGARTDRPDRSP